jgi:hypothetical protein
MDDPKYKDWVKGFARRARWSRRSHNQRIVLVLVVVLVLE